MRTAAKYLLTGIVLFAFALQVQMLVIPHYFPTPTVEDLNHPTAVTGKFRYHHASRGASGTWIDGTPLFCSGGAMNFSTCLGRITPIPQGALVTADIVYRRWGWGDVALAMDIRSGGREIFRQNPAEIISAWQGDNFYWFSTWALCFSILITGVIYIFFSTLRSVRSGADIVRAGRPPTITVRR